MGDVRDMRRDGLHTLAGVLHLVAVKVEAVANGAEPDRALEGAASVLEGQATVLREWIQAQPPHEGVDLSRAIFRRLSDLVDQALEQTRAPHDPPSDGEIAVMTVFAELARAGLRMVSR
jgi:hypothetical protein